jgi:four helix bundle protein
LLPAYWQLSTGGDVWLNLADQTLCRFHPANIAEGHGRENTGSFIQQLRIAQGSLKELETHLLLSERVGIAIKDEVHARIPQCEEVGKMLRSLIRSIQAKRE